MARRSRILGRKNGIANKEAARKSHNKSYRKMKETRPTQYQAKRESRKKARPAYIARVKSFVQHEKILNTVEVNNGRLFASLPDGTTKEIFDSVHKYKSGGKDKELSREVWAQGEVNRLQELGLEGMDRVSARSLFKLNKAWNSREVYVMKGRAKYGYPMHSV